MTDQEVSSRDQKQRRPRRNKKTDWLGERLRQLYDGFGQSPIPSDLQKVLDQLGEDEASEGGAK